MWMALALLLSLIGLGLGAITGRGVHDSRDGDYSLVGHARN